MSNSPDQLLTPAKAASMINTTPRYLEQMRYEGRGPHFIKLHSKAVRYRASDVENFRRAREDDTLLAPIEVASWLDITVDVLFTLTSTPDGPVQIRVDGVPAYRRRDVEAYLARVTHNPAVA